MQAGFSLGGCQPNRVQARSIFFEKNGKCSDQKIYDFLVALTRARKKIFLVSCDGKEPKFMTWKRDRVEKTIIAAT